MASKYLKEGENMPNKLKTHSKINRGFGWQRPKYPDFRHPKLVPHFLGTLPSVVDLRSKCPPVYDQGSLGSCTAQAWAALAEFLQIKYGQTVYVPSRLFIYYNERAIEGTVNIDSGASLTDGATVLTKQGSPQESLWWYNITKFAVKPNLSVYADGLKHLLRGTGRVNQDLASFQNILASGLPIVGGFTVYESFETVTSNGIVPMPKSNEYILGGHAVMIVGYDNNNKWWITRNSWGTSWGAKGYFYMPYNYFLSPDLADDFWSATNTN